MNSIQPSVDKLVAYGNSQLGKVYTPNWVQEKASMDAALDKASRDIQGLNRYADQTDALGKYTTELNQIKNQYLPQLSDNSYYTNQLNSIAEGNLPQQYLNNMQTVYNNMYKTTMGAGLNSLAARGVINSSALNNATNQIQQNLTNQMAKDYASNLQTASGLVTNAMNQRNNALTNAMNVATGNVNARLANDRENINTALAQRQGLINAQVSNANDKYNLASTTQQNSWYAPQQALSLATAQNTAGNNTLNSVGNVYNNASYIKTTTNSNVKRGLL